MIILGTVLAVILSGCSEDIKYTTNLPESGYINSGEGVIYLKNQKEETHALLWKDSTLTFKVEIPEAFDTDTVIPLNTSQISTIVDNYNEFMCADRPEAKDYSVFPSTQYTFSGVNVKKGETSAEATLVVKQFTGSSNYGDYILPVNFSIHGRDYLYHVFVRKDGDFSPLSATNQKAMPAGAYSCPDRKEPMKMIAYVETNNYDIRNYGQVVLENSKKPVFDAVVLFAANMNYDATAKKRVVYFNDKLQPIIKNPEKYIKPLTDRGIKVIITLLPNHQGVGYANFQNYNEALAFAKDMKVWTDKLGIDGWDIDEEYADYGNQSSLPTTGVQSYFWYMRAMKEVMPNKMLTLYDYGHSLQATSVDDQGKKASDYIDLSWADYWVQNPSYAGIPNNRFGIFSYQANYYDLSYAESVAGLNLQGCYGLQMFFNINPTYFLNATQMTYLSKATQLFYGERAVFSGKYHVGPTK